tara:strand:- start:698 stop:2383 length:1686 start_codon:yes stop_codon:yes gene_type:complete
MADQVKQLAFKKFTLSELQNGTAANVLTTNASTHYVIKSIEATQGYNDDAVSATATLGLTAGLSAGEFTSLGTVAKKDRIGLSGSAIMDASSTLTIRPVAKTITFTDEKIFQGGQNSTTNSIFHEKFTPSVNSVVDAGIATETTTDKTSVTYSGGSYPMQNYPQSNYIIRHTNANGVELRIAFSTGNSSGCSFEVWNADGTYYGYYYDSYDAPQFDGERYIFWVACDGASSTRIKWYDLDESTTNLAAANTLGGNNGRDFCHGQTQVWADSPNIQGRSSYDNHMNTFYKNRHTDGRRYLAGWSQNADRMWMCEIPATLTNDSSTTPAAKWLYLNNTSQSTNGTDPFGNTVGNAWNISSTIKTYANTTNNSQLRLTYDPEKERYYLWYCYSNNQWFCWTFTQAQWDDRPSGNTMRDPNWSSGQQNYGLRLVSTDSASEINMSSNVFISYSGDNGYIPLANSSYYSFWGNAYPYQYAPTYMDGKNWFFKDNNSGHPTNGKCVKINMATANSHEDMFPNTTISAHYNPDLLVTFGSPTQTTIDSRDYTVAPSLKIRVTGILADQ